MIIVLLLLHVTFCRELSLQNYDSGDVITYSLYAVINHDGSLYGGHCEFKFGQLPYLL